MASNDTPDRPRRPPADGPDRPRSAFGPVSFAGKVALATLALILLFVIVGGIVLATHLTRREVGVTPNAELQQR
jgi:hypothetical protein